MANISFRSLTSSSTFKRVQQEGIPIRCQLMSKFVETFNSELDVNVGLNVVLDPLRKDKPSFQLLGKVSSQLKLDRSPILLYYLGNTLHDLQLLPLDLDSGFFVLNDTQETDYLLSLHKIGSISDKVIINVIKEEDLG